MSFSLLDEVSSNDFEIISIRFTLDFLEILGELLRDFLRFLDPEDDFAFAEPSLVLSEEGVVSPSSQFGQSQGLLGNRFESSVNYVQNNIINAM